MQITDFYFANHWYIFISQITDFANYSMPRELLVCVGRMLYANHALSVLFPLNLRLWEISWPKSSILHMNEKMGLAHEKALLLQISECPLVWYSSLVHFCVHNSEELFPFWNINFIAAFCITPGIFLSNYPWFIPKRLLLAIQSKMCLGSFILVATVSLYFFLLSFVWIASKNNVVFSHFCSGKLNLHSSSVLFTLFFKQ